VLVVAKAPRPGRVKTRLHRAFSPVQAEMIAETSLRDTLEAVGRCGAARRLIALDGPSGPWLPPGFEVVPQVRGSLAERLQAAWDHAGGPGLQIGMDTPQVDADLLDRCLSRLLAPGTDAVLGPAADGGWWAIGFRAPPSAAFAGVAMSRSDTGGRQLARLRELGLRTVLLPVLRDLDHPEDVTSIRRTHPALRTALVAARMAGAAMP
jgi:glycosyltransferase A (GT-A) superfamily protein (DUF2064 family)